MGVFVVRERGTGWKDCNWDRVLLIVQVRKSIQRFVFEIYLTSRYNNLYYTILSPSS